jgi:hypothetical protein
MSTNYKDYSPGSGSYKVEEAGSIRGISSPGYVCAQMGSLTFSHDAFSFPARGLDLALTRISQCAVKGVLFPAGANPARQLSLQPEALEAVQGGNELD